jgi:hypothetical protein
MSNYSFSEINDKEFEELSCDLLSELYGKKIERFKSGRDAGVDGRFFSDNKEEIIIQCKHYQKTENKQLISKLKSEELPKVEKLDPSKYILVTSLPLSRLEKKKIYEIFDPFPKNFPSFILFQENFGLCACRYIQFLDYFRMRDYKL